jgi:hypothetical protein
MSTIEILQQVENNQFSISSGSKIYKIPSVHDLLQLVENNQFSTVMDNLHTLRFITSKDLELVDQLLTSLHNSKIDICAPVPNFGRFFSTIVRIFNSGCPPHGYGYDDYDDDDDNYGDYDDVYCKTPMDYFLYSALSMYVCKQDNVAKRWYEKWFEILYNIRSCYTDFSTLYRIARKVHYETAEIIEHFGLLKTLPEYLVKHDNVDAYKAQFETILAKFNNNYEQLRAHNPSYDLVQVCVISIGENFRVARWALEYIVNNNIDFGEYELTIIKLMDKYQPDLSDDFLQ